MECTPRPLVEHLREQERHNVTVITVGSKYEVYVRSPASSHMQTLKQPFQTLAIKWEVNIFEKKSSCVFILHLNSSCVFLPSCVRLWYCVVVMLHEHVNDYTTIAGQGENETNKILWNFVMKTDHPFPARRRKLVIIKQRKITCQLLSENERKWKENTRILLESWTNREIWR